MTDYTLRAPRISRFAKGRTYTIEGIKENMKAPQESYLLALIAMLKKLEHNTQCKYVYWLNVQFKCLQTKTYI